LQGEIVARRTMTRNADFYNIKNLHILAIIFILLTSQSLTALSFAAADNSALMELISRNEDPRMDVKDLAFFLVTHDFDAIPKKNHVEVNIDGSIYILVPNGQLSGLANVTVAPL